MLCKKCGAELPDGTEKCIFCGAVLAEKENTDNPAPEEDTVYDENERKRREQIDKMVAEKKQQLSEIEERRNSKKQKQKRKKIIIICLVVAVVAAGAGIGAYYIKDAIDFQKVSQTPSPSPSPTVTAAAQTPSPEPGETLAPVETPEVQATPVPTGNTQSWSSTGNTGSGRSPSSGSSTGSVSTGTSGNKNTAAQNSSSSGTASGGGTSSSSAQPVLKNTGISTKTVDSKLVKGGQVIYNQSTGRYLMTFISDNTVYYANVSAGSTTEQINGKYMTVTAAPTGETYDGSTVYEISSLTNYNEKGYILSDSGTKLLTNDDIAGLSKDELALARNEIYARHGRKFKMAVYQDYFNKCSWYSINPNYNYADDNSNLNEIEAKNVAFILKAENAR